MSAMAESFRIPIDIDYSSQRNENTLDLQNKVLQIINQKGHFRHVAEQSLVAEDSDEGEDEDSELQHRDEEVEETSEKRDEKLVKGREDMYRQLERAQQDTLVALDMVSFLLSKHSTPAQTTMSDHLKERVPTGALDSKVVHQRTPTESKAKLLTLNSQGWRSKGFSSASQSLASASDRMRNEAERESKYWEQVSNLRDSGMAISRYPRESHAVAVHFGSVNASSHFQQLGIGLLRQDADSHVYLDRGRAANHGKSMHIDIYRGTRRTGSYSLNRGTLVDKTKVVQTILDARDELTVDELFHEMGREGRIIANQGVMTRGQSISFDVEHEYEVVLTVNPTSLDSNDDFRDNSLAEYIGLSLQSLLQQAHRHNYDRRTCTPPSLVAKPHQTPEYAILRPLVAGLQHRVAVDDLRFRIKRRLLEPVRLAGLDIDWQDTSPDSGQSANDRLGQVISSKGPTQSVFSLSLPTGKTARVTVISHMGSPVYGTQYEISGIDRDFASVKPKVYHNLETILTGLAELLIIDLVSFIASVTTDVHDRAEKSSKRWTVSQPHSGELKLQSPETSKIVAAMRVDIADGKLILRISPAKADYQKGKKILAWTWSNPVAANMASITGHPQDIGIEQGIAEKLTLGETVRTSLNLAS